MLTIAGCTSLTYLAGCTDIISDSGDPVELCAVSIQNLDGWTEDGEDGDTYHAELQVMEDDDIVAEEAGNIVPYDDDSDEPHALVITVEELDSNEGLFSVRGRIDDDDWIDRYLPDEDVDNEDDPVISQTRIEYGSLRGFHTFSHADCDYL